MPAILLRATMGRSGGDGRFGGGRWAGNSSAAQDAVQKQSANRVDELVVQGLPW